MKRMHDRQAGFALVAVIWTLGLITLLGTAVVVGARYRTMTATNTTAVAEAEAAAESAVNLAIAASVASPADQGVKFPLRCRLPGGERATITVEDETGKFDLNTATPAALTRLFTALTRDQSASAQIVANIAAFRGQQKTNAAPPGTNVAELRFTTVMQLDRVDGISPALFRAALRHTTVRSGRPEPDLDAASPALLALLRVEPKQTAAKKGIAAGAGMTIRADISARDGTRFIREALISIEAGNNGRPYIIREWRRGDIERLDEASRQAAGGGNRACLQLQGLAAM